MAFGKARRATPEMGRELPRRSDIVNALAGICRADREKHGGLINAGPIGYYGLGDFGGCRVPDRRAASREVIADFSWIVSTGIRRMRVGAREKISVEVPNDA